MRRRAFGVLVLCVLAIAALSGSAAANVPADADDANPIVVNDTDGALINVTTNLYDRPAFQSGGITMVGEDSLGGQGSTVVFKSPADGAEAELDSTENKLALSNMSVSNQDLRVEHSTFPTVTIGGGADQFNYSTMAVDDGKVDFRYSGTSDLTVTIRPVSAGINICAKDADTGATLECATSTNGGKLEFTSLDASAHNVKLVTGDGPTLKNGKPQGFKSDRDNVKFSVKVEDPDFPNEDVTVEFYHAEKGLMGTDTVSSEGRASITVSSIHPSTNVWWAEASDNQGFSDRTQNFTVNTPGVYEVRNESDNVLINDRRVTGIFLTNSGTDRRTTNDATIDGEGLPENIDVELGAETVVNSHNFFNITYRGLKSYNNYTFLMTEKSTSIDTVNMTFTLNDETGAFPPDETRLDIHKSQGGSWTRVASGVFGGTNTVEATLRQDTQYKLNLTNTDSGETHDFPIFKTPSTDSASETLTVQEDFSDQNVSTWRWNAVYNQTSVGQDRIYFEFNDPKGQTTDLRVRIYEYGNDSNALTGLNVTGPLGKQTLNRTVTGNDTNTTWVVEATADNARDGKISQKWILNQQRSEQDFFDPELRGFLSVFLLIVTGFLFGGFNANLGGVILPLMAMMLWYVEWLPDSIGMPAIVAALVVGTMIVTRNRGRATQ